MPRPGPAAVALAMAPALSSPAAAVRLLLIFGTLTCLGAGEGVAERRYPDEEVLASQSYYPAAWRKHFNDGDVEFCGKAYVPGASLHVAVQPGLAALSELTGWKDGMTVRGQDAITHFWSQAADALGKSYEGDADSGDFASRRFVVDDNTVIVSGPAAWGGAHGKKLSQTWSRLGAEWKILSEMLQVEEYSPPTQKPKANLRSEINNIVKAAEGGGKNDKIAKEAVDIGKVVVKSLGKELSGEAPASAAVEEVVGKAETAAEKKTESAKAVEAAASSDKHSFLPMYVGAACLGAVAAVFYRRSRRRQEASIAGFEAMLG